MSTSFDKSAARVAGVALRTRQVKKKSERKVERPPGVQQSEESLAAEFMAYKLKQNEEASEGFTFSKVPDGERVSTKKFANFGKKRESFKPLPNSQRFIGTFKPASRSRIPKLKYSYTKDPNEVKKPWVPPTKAKVNKDRLVEERLQKLRSHKTTDPVRVGKVFRRAEELSAVLKNHKPVPVPQDKVECFYPELNATPPKKEVVFDIDRNARLSPPDLKPRRVNGDERGKFPLVHNEAAHILANMSTSSRAHRKVIKDLCGKSATWRQDLGFSARSPRPLTIGDFVGEYLTYDFGCITPNVLDSSFLQVEDRVMHSKNPKKWKDIERLLVSWIFELRRKNFTRASAIVNEVTPLLNKLAAPYKGEKLVLSNSHEGGLDDLAVVMEAVVQLQTTYPRMSALLDLISFLALLREIKSAAGFAALIYSHFNKFPQFINYATYIAKMMKPFTFSKEGFSEDFMTLMHANYNSIRGSDVANGFLAVVNCFSFMSVMNVISEYVPVDSFKSVLSKIDAMLDKKVPVYLTQNTPITLLQRCVSFVSVLLEKLKNAWMTGSFWELFSSSLSISDWRKTSDIIVDDVSVRLDDARPGTQNIFRTRMERGEYPHLITDRYTEPARSDFMAYLLTHVERFRSMFKGDPGMLATIAATEKKLILGKFTIDNRVNAGEMRIQPYGVLLVGLPGIGKTILTDALVSTASRALDIPFSSSSVYAVPAIPSNFEDGFGPEKVFAVMDDIDQSTAPPAAGVPNHFTTACKIINSKAVNMEQADIESKGKMFAAFKLGLYVTNHHNCKLKGLTEDVHVFYRRFKMRIEVEVKPEFGIPAVSTKATGKKNRVRNPDGSFRVDESAETRNYVQIQASKLTKGCNPHIYYVYEYDPTVSNHGAGDPIDNIPYKLVHTFERDTDFFAYFSKTFKTYVETETLALAERNTHNSDSNFCKTCYLPISVHTARDACFVAPDIEVAHEGYVSDFVFGGLFYKRMRRAIIIAIVLPALYHFMSTNPHFMSVYRLFNPFVRVYIARWAISDPFGMMYAYIENAKVLSDAQVEEREKIYIREFNERVNKGLTYLFGGLGAAAGFGLVVAALNRFYKSCYDPEMTEKSTLKVQQEGWLQDPVLKPPFGVPGTWYRAVPDPYVSPNGLPLVKNADCTLDELASKVRKHYVKVTSGVVHLWAVHLKESFFLMPKHLLRLSLGRSITDEMIFGKVVNFVMPNYTHPLTLSPENTYPVPFRDLMIVNCVAVKPGVNLPEIYSYIPLSSLKSCVSVFDDIGLIKADGSFADSVDKGVYVANLGLETGNSAIRYNPASEYGDCGQLVIGRYGKNLALIGNHNTVQTYSDGVTVLTTKFAEEVVRTELDIGMVHLKNRGLGSTPDLVFAMSQCSKEGLDVTLLPIPEKSSLNKHLKRFPDSPMQPVVLGTITPPLVGGSMRSECGPTSYRDIFSELEFEVVGRTHYFTTPEFKGKMIGDEWHDPFTIHFEAYSNLDSDDLIWLRAIDDYCFEAEKLIGWAEMRPLTDYEAWMGVDTSPINAVNVLTSTGAPFFTKKKGYINLDHVKKEVTIHSSILQAVDEIYTICRSGNVYVPFANGSLKDEAMGVDKKEAMRTRVFCVYAMAFNKLLKKYVSPLLVMFRRYRDFFETRVGMNVSAFESNELVERILSVDPTGTRIFEFDFKNYDIKQSSKEMLAVITCWMRLMDFTSYSEDERMMTRMLLLGCMYHVRCFKNDLVLLTCSLGSGLLVTIDFNCSANSLKFRYCTYKILPDAPFPIRHYVANNFMGDDLGSGVSRYLDIDMRRMQVEYQKLGHVVTSALKQAQLETFLNLEKMTFVKRHFVKVGGRYLMPIELKTLIKMATFCKKSKLSKIDHEATLLTDINRELYLHGEEVFNRWMVFVEKAATTSGCYLSSYYRVKTFVELHEFYLTGKYMTWTSEAVEAIDPLL
jgi:hypothetical protein